MAGNTRSGRKSATPAGAVRPGEWPWQRTRKHAWWTRQRIRSYLERWFHERELITSDAARDALVALADAHWLYASAWRAIDSDPSTPKVGPNCAYRTQAAAAADIRRALTALGVYPLRRPVEARNSAQPSSSPFEQPS